MPPEKNPVSTLGVSVTAGSSRKPSRSLSEIGATPRQPEWDATAIAAP